MKRLKKLICSLLCLLLAGGCHWLMPAMAETETGVSYILYSWDEGTLSKDSQKCKIYTVLPEEEDGAAVTLSKGWYVAQGDITYENRLTVNSDVNLILADGCKVTAKNGITVQGTDTLTIYAQSEDIKYMGSLEATGNDLNAGIGGLSQNAGGTVTIQGGHVIAHAGTQSTGIGGGWGKDGEVRIYGGIVEADTSGLGAAIGGGANGSCTVTIYGGSVDAGTTGGGAAIGGGYNYEGSGGTITIYGGSVSASASDWGAAIGGGWSGSGGTITISGGSVSASASDCGAAIGSGKDGSIESITISGGSVDASAGKQGAAIGSGAGDSASIESITISGGSVSASASNAGAAIGSGENGGVEGITISGGSVSASAGGWGAAIGKGFNGGVNKIIIKGGRISAVNTDAGQTCFGGDDCEISLGWTAATDYVYAGEYTAKDDLIKLTSPFRPADAEEVLDPATMENGIISADSLTGKLLVPPGSSNESIWPGAEFTLPANLREVKANAFEGIDAKTVLVPSGVTSIGAEAFKGSGIQMIRFLGANTTVDITAFNNCGPVIAFARAGTATWESLKRVAGIVTVAVG